MSKLSKHVGIKCPKCKVRLFSWDRYDYVVCICDNHASVDGGSEYIRVGWVHTRPKMITHSERLDRSTPGEE